MTVTMSAQNRAMLEFLRANPKGATALEILTYCGIYRAGARVYDLRKAGFTIVTTRHPSKTASYRLIEP